MYCKILKGSLKKITILFFTCVKIGLPPPPLFLDEKPKNVSKNTEKQLICNYFSQPPEPPILQPPVV